MFNLGTRVGTIIDLSSGSGSNVTALCIRAQRLQLRLQCIAALTGPSCLAVSQFSSDVIYNPPCGVSPLPGLLGLLGLLLSDRRSSAQTVRAADVGKAPCRMSSNRTGRVFTSTRLLEGGGGALRVREQLGINGILRQVSL